MAKEGLAWLWKVPRLNVDISLSWNMTAGLNNFISYSSARPQTLSILFTQLWDAVKSSRTSNILSATNHLLAITQLLLLKSVK